MKARYLRRLMPGARSYNNMADIPTHIHAFTQEHHITISEKLAQDASPRQYYRGKNYHGQYVLIMDCGDDGALYQKYQNTTQILHGYNIGAPKIYACDDEYHLILIEDYGKNSFADLINNNIFDDATLYHQAITLCAQFHQKKFTNIDLPIYDRAIFMREANLFHEWFLPFCDIENTPYSDQLFQQGLTQLYDDYISDNMPLMIVMRDFHIDNLFYDQQRAIVQVIDFQDALLGSPAYDVMSLLEDARRDINSSLRQDMLNIYLHHFDQSYQKIFSKHYKIWAIQRHLKVIGIFARLSLRDSKKHYVAHIPRVIRLLQYHVQQLNHNHALSQWLRLDNITASLHIGASLKP